MFAPLDQLLGGCVTVEWLHLEAVYHRIFCADMGRSARSLPTLATSLVNCLFNFKESTWRAGDVICSCVAFQLMISEISCLDSGLDTLS